VTEQELSKGDEPVALRHRRIVRKKGFIRRTYRSSAPRVAGVLPLARSQHSRPRDMNRWTPRQEATIDSIGASFLPSEHDRAIHGEQVLTPLDAALLGDSDSS